MRLLRRPALGLLIAATLPAAAQTGLPPLPVIAATPANLYGMLANQWFVGITQVSAGTEINGASLTDSQQFKFPSPSDLGHRAEMTQAVASKSAAAWGSTADLSLSAAAQAQDPLHPDATGIAAVGYSLISYWAVLDQNYPLRVSLPLQGRLTTTGSIATGLDASMAGVVAFANGSDGDPTGAGQAATFAKAGIDLNEGGEPLLRQFSMLKPSTQTYLDVFAAQSDTSHTWVDVKSTLNVTASGMEIHCDGTEPAAVKPMCGRYFYYLSVALFTGAQNGAQADFAHAFSGGATYSVNGGPALALNASTVSAVPEPGSALLLALGLLGMAGYVGRRRGR